MDWHRTVDGYCERLGPAFWAEPVNAATNLAFLIAALIMMRRLQGTGLGLGWGLASLLFAIGVGSFLFHSFAQVWAAVADVVPIMLFTLLYIFAANRDYWEMPPLWAAVGALLFVPYAALVAPMLTPLIGGSSAYAPLPLLIFIYAAALAKRAPQTALGLAGGAAVLTVSIVMRTLDLPLCENWHIGTHFLWHLLNAVMLGWMIEVYRRHMLARRTHQG